MKTLSIREMRATLGRLGDLLSTEGELVVTRHGKAIARVVPIEARRTIPSRAGLRASLPELSSSVDLIREDRDER
jgi:antitoxin (DNA-binding transcriptional repressor) of toxin-antitoxin stability system